MGAPALLTRGGTMATERGRKIPDFWGEGGSIRLMAVIGSDCCSDSEQQVDSCVIE